MPYLQNPPTIALDALTWAETGEDSDAATRLTAHIRIGSLDMHLEAWEIDTEFTDYQQVKEATMRQDDFGALCSMMDCYFETTTINDRKYVLIATPFGG